MKAVQVKGFGDVDQLELVELPDPEPQPGEVRIRVEASGLNYADIMQREVFIPVDQSRRIFPVSKRRALSRLAKGCRWARGDGRFRRWLSCGALVCQRGHVHAHSGFDVFRRSCCFSGPISDRVSRAHDSWQSCSRRNRFDSCSGGGVGTAAVRSRSCWACVCRHSVFEREARVLAGRTRLS